MAPVRGNARKGKKAKSKANSAKNIAKASKKPAAKASQQPGGAVQKKKKKWKAGSKPSDCYF